VDVTTSATDVGVGFVVLYHDGQAWLLTHQAAGTVHRNSALAAGEVRAAKRWAADLIPSLAPIPDGMGHHSHVYGMDYRNGQLVVTPVGGLSRDDQGWVMVDGLGHVTHRAEDIGHDEQEAANRWAESITATGRVRSRRWRLNVGQFPDGSYGDPDGRLGRQRLRRAWNWTLDRLGI
jgi:hypothetical protein